MDYSEIRIPVGRIPVAIKVSPIGIGIEPSDLLASLPHEDFSCQESCLNRANYDLRTIAPFFIADSYSSAANFPAG